MYKHVPTLLLAGGMLAATLAEAQSLKVRQAQAYAEERLKSNIEYAERECGKRFTQRFDWPTFPAAVFEQYGVYGYCGEILDTLAWMCSDKLAKEAIVGQLDTVVCKAGPVGGRALVRDGSTLIYTIDWEAANNGDFIRGWVGDNL